MKRRKINYISLMLIVGILLSSILNIYLLIDRKLHYINKDYFLSLVEKYDNVSIGLLYELFPNKTFYFKDNELVSNDLLNLNKNTYNFSKYLDTSGSFYTYNDSRVKTSIGIDVSSNNGDIDWDKVKESGIDFAIIRLGYRGYTEGGINLDSCFEKNMKGAIKAGLDVGVYFFSQSINEEEINEEVDFVLENVKNYTFKLPIVFDMEHITFDAARSDNLNSSMVTNLTRIFVDRINSNGYKTMIYGNRNWLMGMLDLSKFEDVDKWLALYSDSPNYKYQYTMWQYSDVGKVSGINGNVDLNILFKEY